MILRKKPIEIEGFQMTAERMNAPKMRMRLDSAEGWPDWAIKALTTTPGRPGELYQMTGTVWCVHTLEGVMRVSVDDWILRGVQGELYPCNPDVLALTYYIVGTDENGS